MFASVHSGVHQDSVHGPILIFIYTKHLSAIFDSHSIIHHLFADDLPLLMTALPAKMTELLHSMLSCINFGKAWASVSMHIFNDIKTELLLVTSNELSITITYLYQSPLAMFKYP